MPPGHLLPVQPIYYYNYHQKNSRNVVLIKKKAPGPHIIWKHVKMALIKIKKFKTKILFESGYKEVALYLIPQPWTGACVLLVHSCQMPVATPTISQCANICLKSTVKAIEYRPCSYVLAGICPPGRNKTK